MFYSPENTARALIYMDRICTFYLTKRISTRTQQQTRIRALGMMMEHTINMYGIRY